MDGNGLVGGLGMFYRVDLVELMKICLLVIGKTDADYIRAGIEEYEKRLRKYVGYEMKVLAGYQEYQTYE